MATRHAFLLVTLVVAAALAGCAESPAQAAEVESPEPTSRPATTTPAAATSPSTRPSPTSAQAETPAEGEAEAPIWHAFRFTEEVDPVIGKKGLVSSFTFVHTDEEDGEVREVEAVVTVLGEETVEVRASRMDMMNFADGPTVVSTPVRVQRLQHDLTILRDDSGEHAAGESARVTIHVPVEREAVPSTFTWFFVKLDHASDEGNGSWEYHVTPEMHAEMEEGGAMYMPHVDGSDATLWWGWNFMGATYGLTWFSAWVNGDVGLEEGRHTFAGVTYEVDRVARSVSGLTFDAWEISVSSRDTGDGYSIAASPDLPIPFAYEYANGEGTRMAYRLTELALK